GRVVNASSSACNAATGLRMNYKASIIAVGSEMLGPTRLDTNSLKITSVLESIGVPLVRRSIVADSLHALADEIGFSLAHSAIPGEVEWMLKTYFEPWLEQASGGRTRHRRVLKVAGLGESAVEERLKPYYDAHPGEPLTILASPGAVELHLIFDSKETIAQREREMLAIFGVRIFGFDDDTLESVIGSLLTERRETVSTAESCTGGLLAQRITDVSGST